MFARGAMPLGTWSLSQDFTSAKVGTISHTAKRFAGE